jgi:2-polyprenyl-3-methyl-5-hydroxy-6-metoxy-1,4-benzoquinol methylase
VTGYHDALWETVPEGTEPAGFERRLAWLMQSVPAGARVLDLGCGEGRFAAELLARGDDVVAADVAAEPLRRARVASPALSTVLVPDGGELPLEVAGFDAVWLGEVLEHVRDTQALLSEVRRVLRPSGLLVLSTPDHRRRAMIGWALRTRSFDAHFDPRGDHLRFYTRRTLAALLEDMRLSVQEIRSAKGTLLARARRERF